MEQQHRPNPSSQIEQDDSLVDQTQREAANTASPHTCTARLSTRRSGVRRVVIRMTITAAMIALSVILCRLLGFPQSGIWRVEFGFLPIAIIGFLWGPFWSTAAYTASDLIGAAIFTGVNPFITIEKAFTGLVMGLTFYRYRSGRTRIGLARILTGFSVIAVFGDFLMMAFIFKYAFGYTWEAAFAFRAVNAAVNLVLRSVTMYLCDLRLTARLLHEGEKFGV